jgi:hypothetical protein
MNLVAVVMGLSIAGGLASLFRANRKWGWIVTTTLLVLTLAIILFMWS